MIPVVCTSKRATPLQPAAWDFDAATQVPGALKLGTTESRPKNNVVNIENSVMLGRVANDDNSKLVFVRAGSLPS